MNINYFECIIVQTTCASIQRTKKYKASPRHLENLTNSKEQCTFIHQSKILICMDLYPLDIGTLNHDVMKCFTCMYKKSIGKKSFKGKWLWQTVLQLVLAYPSMP